MKKIFNYKINLVYLLFFVIFIPFFVQSETDDTGLDIQLNVISCNNNGVCEIGIGEDHNNCPVDCDPPVVPPVTPPSSSGSSGGGYVQAENLVIENIEFSSETESVTTLWNTNRPTLNIFYWGQTSNYELGTLAETDYSIDHTVKISNLTPNTKYYFKIFSKDKNGVEIYYESEFFTKSEIGFFLPSNITDLKAKKYNEGIIFSWRNAQIKNFSSVRIVRKERSFPLGPLDGKVLYEGGANSFYDDSYDKDKEYYYAFFVRDKNGNYSSGIFLKIKKEAFENLDVLKKDEGVEIDENVINPLGIKLQDFDFNQNNFGISFFDNIVNIKSNSVLFVSIDDKKLPQGSTIVLEIIDNTSEIDSTNIILKHEKELEKYLGDFRPNFLEGEYFFTIRIYDRSMKIIDIIDGSFVVSADYIQEENNYNLYWISILFLVLLILYFYSQKTPKNK